MFRIFAWVRLPVSRKAKAARPKLDAVLKAEAVPRPKGQAKPRLSERLAAEIGRLIAKRKPKDTSRRGALLRRLRAFHTAAVAARDNLHGMRYVLAVTALVIALGGTVYAGYAAWQRAKLRAVTVATIDGQPITRSDLLAEAIAAGTDPSRLDPAATRQMLERIVDRRLLTAAATRQGIAHEERYEALRMRVEQAGKERQVQTDNLTVALFQHDTNRNQEPNLHFHAVVANMTQAKDGIWKALRNDRLWQFNTLLNAMTMARFRVEVEKLGYRIGDIGKHGNFEAAGIDREAVMAFSTRRQEVLEARRGSGLDAGVIATLATRSAKEQGVDRDALLSQWEERAWGLGLDLQGMVRDARERSTALAIADRKAAQDRPSIAQRGKALVLVLAERLGIREGDPLVPARIHLRPVQEIAAAHAVAFAVRHLSEREAAFMATDLAKAALNIGLPATMPLIEKRIGQLTEHGALSKGRGVMEGWLTTADAAALESRMLAEIGKGQGAVTSILSSDEAGPQLQASARLNFGMKLNAGQEAAGRIILSSTNRIVAVQGVAGAGKSSLLRPTAQILAENGKRVIGLGVQNTLVRMLERETGIPSMTLHRFLGQHRSLLEGSASKSDMAEARAAYRDTVLVLDEASMVSTRDQDRLVRIANLLEVDRLVLMGDPKQLGAVEAGKPFALALAAGTESARMETNLRARSEILKRAQAAAQQGRTGEAMGHLKDHIVEISENGAIVAAERWLSLPPGERERTGIYVSGRLLREEVNAAVQTGLAANGEIGPDKITLNVLTSVNATREELRQVRTYAPGMVLEVATRQSRQNLAKGRYEVLKVDVAKGTVELRDSDGYRQTFLPSRIGAKGENQALQLHERKALTVYAGDTIRWTANDHQRGLINADRATITAIDEGGLTVRTSTGMDQTLMAGDPMLARIDLAYALNAHMAQGLTSDKGIAVMDSRSAKLLSARNFLVTITRLRDELTLIVDNRDKVEVGIGRNLGDKTSALEVTERLGAAAAKGEAAGKPPDVTRPQDVENKRELERTITKVVPFEMGI